MHGLFYFNLFSVIVYYAQCLTLQNDATIVPPVFETSPPPPESDGCDPSSIPVMENFDMQRFSGNWYELAKSASGYIDMNDGIWIIKTTNSSTTFLFSGRSINSHCIHPIKGKIYTSDQPPGTLHLHYKTYSNHVEETIRVLFTDYTSVAVIYKCVHHVHREREVCHPAGFVGSIWTRQPHVNLQVFESAVRYLEMACVHKSVLIVRNQVGTCEVDDFDMDDFPVPDFCYQPKDLGFCGGNLQRYYFNAVTKTCEIFTYYGCGGNGNNFMSLAECQGKCLNVPPKEMVCLSIAECAIHCPPCCSQGRDKCVECNCEQIIEEGWTCVKSPGYCQPECAVEELYPSCYLCSCNTDVNEPFDDPDIPACLEVKATGNCENPVERYYYNAITGECEQFIYSGCRGNKNNFESMEQCVDTCASGLQIYKSDVKIDDDDGGDFATAVKFNQWIIGTLLFFYIIITHKIL